MLGILYLLFTSIGSLGHNIRENIAESERKNEAYNSYDHTYYDKYGKRILVENNRWIHSNIRNGDRVLEDVTTHRIYRNFSEEERKEYEKIRKKEAIENNKTVYLYQYNKDIPYSDPWKGDRYKDIETGKIYVIRKRYVNIECGIGEVLLYLDISTGKFVRKTDEQIEIDKKWIDKLNNIDEEIYKYINRITKNKQYTKEEINMLIDKRKNKIIHNINNNYISNDNMDKYLIEINNKQMEYLNSDKYKSLYYA